MERGARESSTIKLLKKDVRMKTTPSTIRKHLPYAKTYVIHGPNKTSVVRGMIIFPVNQLDTGKKYFANISRNIYTTLLV